MKLAAIAIAMAMVMAEVVRSVNVDVNGMLSPFTFNPSPEDG